MEIDYRRGRRTNGRRYATLRGTGKTGCGAQNMRNSVTNIIRSEECGHDFGLATVLNGNRGDIASTNCQEWHHREILRSMMSHASMASNSLFAGGEQSGNSGKVRYGKSAFNGAYRCQRRYFAWPKGRNSVTRGTGAHGQRRWDSLIHGVGTGSCR